MTRRILISSVLLLVLLGSNGVDSEDTTPVTGDSATTVLQEDESTNTGSTQNVTGSENPTQPFLEDESTTGGSAPDATNVNTSSEDVSEDDKTTATAPTTERNRSDPVGGSSLATDATVVESNTVSTVAGTEAGQSSSEVPVTSAQLDAETNASLITTATTLEDRTLTSTKEDPQEITVVTPASEMTSGSGGTKEETSVTQGITAKSTAAASVSVTAAATDKASTAAPTQHVETTDPGEVEQITSEQGKLATSESAAQKQTTQPARATVEDQTESTTQALTTPTDPCSEGGYEIIPRTKDRYYKNTDVSGPHDDKLEQKWYKFTIDGADAEIPRVCIKPGHCGADMPYTLDPDFKPPKKGQQVKAELQGSYVLHGRTKCNAEQASVVVHNCGDFFVYNLTSVYGQSNICLKKKSETVEYDYQGNPPATEAPTTEAPLNLPKKDAEAVQSQYTVTIVTSNNNGLTNEYLRELDLKLRKAVADELNKKSQTPVEDTETQTTAASVQTTAATDASKAEATTTHAPAASTTSAFKPAETTTNGQQETTTAQAAIGPVADQKVHQGVARQIDGDVDGGVGPPMRFRRNSDTVYTEANVFYVRPTPREKDNQKEITIYVEHDKDGPVDGKTLLEALKRLNETGALGNMTGESVLDIHQGYPEDIAVIKPAKSIWHTHMGLFITVIILAVICIILLIIGLICLRCQRTGGYSTNNPEKTAITLEEGRNGHGSVESPLSDEEIVRGEASTLQAATPSYTANGRGQHISKEEDNGWVVPINELSDQERSLVDTEDTKL